MIVGARGRGAQMNRAAAATGDVLLFLHADCSLEEGALLAAERCLARRGVVAGCFHMTVPVPKLVYRLSDWCATACVRLTVLVYGDPGLSSSAGGSSASAAFPCYG